MKTTLADLAELIKEDASLKLAQGSVLLLSVPLVFFLLRSSPLLISFHFQDSVLVTEKEDIQHNANRALMRYVTSLINGLHLAWSYYLLQAV